jgi:hypothetical protein
MIGEEENEGVGSEEASPPAKQTGKERLRSLAAEAKPELATEPTRRRLLDEWEKANNVVLRARQMLKDAIVTRDAAAEKVVRTLGRADLRYKDVLYSPSAKGDTIYLRELKKRPNG